MKRFAFLSCGLFAALVFLAPACFGSAPTFGAVPGWQRPVDVPKMPRPDRSGLALIDGVRLWYAEFGHGTPVLLLHGGLVNSNYWGLQIAALSGRHRVIVLDSRGHGRSERGTAPIDYGLMAADAIALLDHLHVRKTAIVGWSDGANVGLRIAIHHPDRVTRLFAFAGDSGPTALKRSVPTPASRVFLNGAMRLYRELSPTPGGFAAMMQADSRMAATGPNFTDQELRSIRVPVWIVLGDHDQFIKREDSDHMALLIPGAAELILPGVGHGAPLQDAILFDAALIDFLE